MKSRTEFITDKQTKLVWKLFKHSVGVVTGREVREGRPSSVHSDSPDYIDIPLHA